MMLTVLTTTEHPNRSEPQQLEQLLIQIASGDREAFSQLYRSTYAAVYALMISFLKNTHDAQDAAQDVYVRVWESAGSYHARSSPMAWILTIARNMALTKLRQGEKVVGLEDGEWDAIPAGQPNVTPEDRHVLQEAMAGLGDQERQIVLLHAVSGLKHREIADILKLPLPTVLSKYHRALKKLKNLLKEDDVR